MLTVVRFCLFAVVLFFAQGVLAQAAPTFYYHGRLTKADGTAVSGAVNFRVSIASPGNENCLLYQETFDTSTVPISNGFFSLPIGSGTVLTAKVPFARLFANNAQTIANLNCPGDGSVQWTPQTYSGRRFTLEFSTTNGASWDMFGPELINYNAMAMEAANSEAVGGFSANSLLRVVDGSGNPFTPVAPLTQTNYQDLVNLLSGTSSKYLQTGSNGALLPSFNGSPGSPAAGDVWYDSSSNQLKFYNGASSQTLGTGSGTVSSITLGNGLTGTSPLTTTGTINVDVGNTAGKIVQVAAGDKLPIIDGSNLTNLNYSQMTGTISGATVINTTGNITTTGTVSAVNVTSTTDSTKNFLLYNSFGTHKITLTAPVGLASDYSLVMPTGTPAISGQALTSDTNGNLLWASTGTVTNVGLTMPSIFSVSIPSIANFGTFTVTLNSQPQNQVLAAPAGAAGTPSFRALTIADLPMTTLDSRYFLLGGNALGGPAKLGTIDSNPLTLITNDSPVVTITNTGLVGIGSTNPSGVLDVEGGTAAVATDGKNIQIAAQSAGTGGNNNGGNIILIPGTGSGTGKAGAVGIGTTSPGSAVDINGALTERGMAAPSLSAAGQGVIYFDSTSQTFQVSQNGGAYTALVGGGGSLATTGGTMTGQLIGADGLASVPGFAFASDTGTGLYDVSPGTLGVAAGGLQALTVTSTAVTLAADKNLTMSSGAGKFSETYSGSGPAAAITDTAVASGDILDLTTTSTAAVNNDKALNIAVSGTNGTSGVTRYGVYSNVTAAGTTSLNVAGYFSATGGTSNYGLIVANGSVGIGTTSPNAAFDIKPATAAAQLIEPFGASAGNTGELRFEELAANGTTYVGFKAPDSITTSKIWTLPAADGGSGTVLSTNGSGVLSWASVAVSGGTATAADGTAAAPGMTFTGDTGTGFYQDSSHVIGVTNNGTESMKLSSSGITGTGALAVTAGGTNQNLTLSGSGTGNITMSNSDGTQFQVLDGGASTVNHITAKGAATTAAPVLATAGSDANINLAIMPKGTGGVGIGTISPASQLDVNGAISLNGMNAIRFPASDSTLGGSIAIGANALGQQDFLAAAPYANTAIGYQSMSNSLLTTAANANTAVGFEALQAVSSGSANTAIGTMALNQNLVGEHNTAVGSAAQNFVLGNQNTSIGDSSLRHTQGNNNVAVGFVAGDDISTGNNNIIIGAYTSGPGVTTGSNNILVGSDVRPPSASTTSNQLNIGNLIFGKGLTSGTTVSNGSVGIGSTSPQGGLDVNTSGTASAIVAPRDTTSNRPTGIAGMVRYNTTSGALEGFGNGAWGAYTRIVARFDAAAQSASVGTTDMITPANATLYALRCNVELTQAATTSSTVPSCTVTFTSGDAPNNAHTVNAVSTCTLNTTSNCFFTGTVQFYAKAGTQVQLSAPGYVSSGATSMQYAIHAVLEELPAPQ